MKNRKLKLNAQVKNNDLVLNSIKYITVKIVK